MLQRGVRAAVCANFMDDAVAHILQFYKNFRSYRWVGNRMVVRVTDRLTETAVKKLSEDFADVLATGEIVQSGALPEEANEPELADLPRLVFTPHRRNFGHIRCLLDGINLAETERSPELPTAGSKSNQTATPRP
jgi:hypothetical protein